MFLYGLCSSSCLEFFSNFSQWWNVTWKCQLKCTLSWPHWFGPLYFIFTTRTPSHHGGRAWVILCWEYIYLHLATTGKTMVQTTPEELNCTSWLIWLANEVLCFSKPSSYLESTNYPPSVCKHSFPRSYFISQNHHRRGWCRIMAVSLKQVHTGPW